MKTPSLVVALLLLPGIGLAGDTQEATMPTTETSPTESAQHHVRGTFDVKMEPLESEATDDGISLGRYSLVKNYHGPLEGTATGTMLTVQTPVEGSAAYVAVERVEGSLEGKSGSFALQHRGEMGRGEQKLLVTVVLDSGTGELEGLAGELAIEIEDGRHYYDLRYSLPEE